MNPKKQMVKELGGAFPRHLFDENSCTSRELMEESGLRHSQIMRRVQDMVRAGTWGRVWKLVDGRKTASYRQTKTKKGVKH